MFIDKNSITINGVSMGQYIVEARFGFPKLWSKDTGRNLAGTMSGTLLGVFPKLVLQFRKLTKSELEDVIVPIIDAPSQRLTYYDPKKKQSITITTYTGDYEVVNKKIINAYNKNEPFSCSFISTKKRA